MMIKKPLTSDLQKITMQATKLLITNVKVKLGEHEYTAIYRAKKTFKKAGANINGVDFRI